MLNKTERSVMESVLSWCRGSGCCLVSVNDIEALSRDKKIDGSKINKTLRSLEIDGYFDLVKCKKSDEELFCINLKPKGYSYKRETQQEHRETFRKFFFAVGSAVLTYLVGRLLFLIFK